METQHGYSHKMLSGGGDMCHKHYKQNMKTQKMIFKATLSCHHRLQRLSCDFGYG